MSDIMDRLLDTTDRDAVSDAREEIAALRAEVERLTVGRDTIGNLWANEKENSASLRVEVERLTGERDRQYQQNAEQITRIAALEAENERLRIERDTNFNAAQFHSAKAERLRAALKAWHDAVKIDVKMQGPQFAGVRYLEGRAAWGKTRAALEEKP